MMEVLKAIGYMFLGGVLVHLSWVHAWRMYNRGRQEARK